LKLALLIDAENISPHYTDRIMAEANSRGTLALKRIYGDFSTSEMSSWKPAILYHALVPVQQFMLVSGKNSSDSSLIIDAMDLLYKDSLDGFCVVSSDSDFTRLASRLQEAGKIVIGMGETKTPRTFVSACSQFVYLDVLNDKKKPDLSGSQNEGSSSLRLSTHGQERRMPVSQLKRILLDLAKEYSDEDNRILSSRLRALLSRRYPDFDVHLYGQTRFLPLVQSLGIFHIGSTGDDKGPGKKTYYFEQKIPVKN
jgi:uncharacterized LabA/DUF88 family protein